MIHFSSRFASTIANEDQQRRKFNVPRGKVHPIVYKKAEDIQGYEKFTLDEVIYPEDNSEKVVVCPTIFVSSQSPLANLGCHL